LNRFSFGCTCRFCIGDAADRQKRQKEEERYRQSSLSALHVGSGVNSAWKNLSNPTEMRSRWISLKKKKAAQLLPPSLVIYERERGGERG